MFLRALLACSVLLAGCFHPQVPVARVRRGPAYGHAIDPIAALDVSCGSQAESWCTEYARAVASRTRMELEFAGYAVVDSELLNAETRRRAIKTTDSTTTTEKAGALWKDLTPSKQRELLHSIGARGRLTASIILGGAAPNKTITVQITVTRISDDALAWASQCTIETGGGQDARALDLATRCALESERMW